MPLLQLFAQGTDLPEKTGAQGPIVLAPVCTGDGPEKMAIGPGIDGGFPGPIPERFQDFRSGVLRILAREKTIQNTKRRPRFSRKKMTWFTRCIYEKIKIKHNKTIQTIQGKKGLKPCKIYPIFTLQSFRDGRRVGNQRSHHHGTLQLRLHRRARSRGGPTPWRHRRHWGHWAARVALGRQIPSVQAQQIETGDL